jgi:hypothetical protein
MDRKSCPSCGAEIGADHPHGLCPACLLKEGLQPSAEGDPIRRALEAKLQGQYRLVRMLGRGGMGSVYLARDLFLEREVAIKVVNAASESREMYDRFRREAKTAAKLSHPNIVPLHAFGEVEGMPYFVMGYVRGESLAARLRRDGKLPEEDARRIVAEIADALDHAHRQGVIHRDIKPENVLLDDESGRALLTDFGIAKGVGKGETLTQYGSVVGTPHFMSPEQAAGRADIDARSDIYSLGVMAYGMLSGRLPFEGNTSADILAKHLTQDPPPLRALAPAATDSTVQAVERCLAKDPAGRWPDARSLRLALGTTEESQLPDALQAVEGWGVPGGAVVLTLLSMFSLWVPTPVLVIQVGLIVFIYLFVVARLRREGFSFMQSQRVIWTEPAWWLWWFPAALRRRGNVWKRLPITVRSLRWSLYAVFFNIALLFVGDFPHLYRHPASFTIKMGILAATVALWIVLTSRARRELKRRGLAPADTQRVIVSMPPSRVSFWARPHIAAVLAPATRPETSRFSDSPHEQLQSILRHADELSGPLRPLGTEAGVAARQLVEAIEQSDRRIADLARNIEPGEEERLAEKIEALAAPVAGVDEYAPMRSLLEKQLDLIRGLSARIEEEKESRNRRVEMLKMLGLHLASLRARVAETPSEVRQLTDEVRELCDEIGRHAAALGERSSSHGGDGMPTVERA